MTLVSFSVPAAKANDSAQERFWQEKTTFYLHLASQPTVPGTAWFRHELNAAAEQANKLRRKEGKTEPSIRVVGADPARIAESYELFTGGRAVSESLQLDRLLREPSQSGPPTVDISTLKGITIAEIDWKPLLKGAKPQLDPLAAAIPADQHALFFPSFAAVTKVFDEANGRDTDFLRMVTPKSEDADLAGRYQRQLGLTLSSLGRVVGPAVIRSVALTGSDPYFPTGTDVAVLFETDQQAALASALQAQIQIAAAKQPDAKPQHGEVEGVAYHGMRSPDRQLCTYVAQLRGAVVVTNSLAQLGRLAKIGKGVEPIASLDEYKFFRTRYPLGDKSETALVFLSDATIRRWCSPQWRIASARRTFTAAALADLTADNVKALEAGKIDAHPLHTDLALVDAGELTLTDSGVSSSTQGTLAWMTPIVEMPIEKVTQAEADAYNQWRDNYQRNWRWAFDPIALRIGIDGAKLSADLTIMPLVANSEYNEFINHLARGRTETRCRRSARGVGPRDFVDQHEIGAGAAMGQSGHNVCAGDRAVWLAGELGFLVRRRRSVLERARASSAREARGIHAPRLGKIANCPGSRCFQRLEAYGIPGRGARIYRSDRAGHDHLGTAYLPRPAVRAHQTDGDSP